MARPLLAPLLFSAASLALRTESDSPQGHRTLPPLARFSEVWQAHRGLEARLQEAMPASVQLVLGVFTVPREAAYREVIRSTWLQQRGVCYWQEGPQEGCSVYVAFVMGRNESVREEPGALVLDVEENMNEGKSMAWMAAAGRRFPWATHYGKMDTDTYPFLHKLLARLAANRTCALRGSPYEWVGRPSAFAMHGESSWAGPFTEGCAYDPCMGWFHTDVLDSVKARGSFRFMAGELYVMSKALVQGVRWERRRGCEDIQMGHLVAEFARERGTCVVLRKPDAHAHFGQEGAWRAVERAKVIDRAWANDF